MFLFSVGYKTGGISMNSGTMIKSKGENESTGYFLLKEGELQLVGFPKIKEDSKVLLNVTDGVVILYLGEVDEKLTDGTYIYFNQDNKRNKTIIEYLVENNAIGCLFVELFGCYFQCINLEVAHI